MLEIPDRLLPCIKVLGQTSTRSFERRDWMTVQPDELPAGGRLIMGLNPPFGFKASLANQFINKALSFKPKLIILIIPKETERLNRKYPPYELIWEDSNDLSGKSSLDSDNKLMEQGNMSPPPLSLWSRSDYAQKFMEIAKTKGHLSSKSLCSGDSQREVADADMGIPGSVDLGNEGYMDIQDEEMQGDKPAKASLLEQLLTDTYHDTTTSPGDYWTDTNGRSRQPCNYDTPRRNDPTEDHADMPAGSDMSISSSNTWNFASMNLMGRFFAVLMIMMLLSGVARAENHHGAYCNASDLSIRLSKHCDITTDFISAQCCDAVFSTLGRKDCLCEVVQEPEYRSSPLAGLNTIVDVYHGCNGGLFVSPTMEDDCNELGSPPSPPKQQQPPPPPTQRPPSTGHLPFWSKAGWAMGIISLLVLLSTAVWVIWRRKRTRGHRLGGRTTPRTQWLREQALAVGQSIYQIGSTVVARIRSWWELQGHRLPTQGGQTAGQTPTTMIANYNYLVLNVPDPAAIRSAFYRKLGYSTTDPIGQDTTQQPNLDLPAVDGQDGTQQPIVDERDQSASEHHEGEELSEVDLMDEDINFS